MKKHSYSRIIAHNLRRVLGVLLTLVLLFGLAGPMPKAEATSNELISVGLYFVNNALPSANLQNVAGYGSGYELGQYLSDSDGGKTVFDCLGEVENTEITILKDTTMYFSGGNFYESPHGSDIVIGAYHLEQANTYHDFNAANRAAASFADGFVAYCDGSYLVRFGSYTSLYDAMQAAGDDSDCIAVGGSEYGITVVDSNTGRILFELDTGESTTLGVVPSGRGETRTWFKGYQYNGGFRYDRPDGGNMHVASIVPLEEYVAAVLCREYYVSWPDETLKAAACCIRTIARAGGKHKTFDVCNSDCCQVYRGVFLDEQWEHAVELCRETEGECIYYDGKPILAVYYSSNGGATASSAETWSVDYPYLQSHYDPFESTVNTGTKEWCETFSLEELTQIARNWGFQCQKIVDVYVSEYSEFGIVDALTFVDVSGKTYEFRGEKTTLFGTTYLSRRYLLIPPGGSAEYTEVLLGEGSKPTAAAHSGASYSGPYFVYNGLVVDSASSLCVMTANGVETVSGEAIILSEGESSTVIHDSADIRLETRTIRNDTNQYMLYGSGWGHNVGLSAYGAYAMGLQGYQYQEILQYYYQDVIIY